ncbi:hypothetical protein B0T20DRAFT_392506 [Sordaria brevicollis]|uniref:Uncharacterized protein n=1 Tax=Sordaria brevicollis TaxID=83679 RepID=A0AAE0UDJ1_SORBR|nr:hypothetical protein B0T20DRAFT_392506 [Sordaria brevicollis]
MDPPVPERPVRAGRPRRWVNAVENRSKAEITQKLSAILTPLFHTIADTYKGPRYMYGSHESPRDFPPGKLPLGSSSDGDLQLFLTHLQQSLLLSLTAYFFLSPIIEHHYAFHVLRRHVDSLEEAICGADFVDVDSDLLLCPTFETNSSLERGGAGAAAAGATAAAGRAAAARAERHERRWMGTVEGLMRDGYLGGRGRRRDWAVLPCEEFVRVAMDVVVIRLSLELGVVERGREVREGKRRRRGSCAW